MLLNAVSRMAVGLIAVGALAGCATAPPPVPSEPTLGDIEDCPVTRPGAGPPGVSPDLFFGSGAAHGNGRLWVGGLWPDGVILADRRFVDEDGAVEMKFGWWREVAGELTITGRRLDAPAPPAHDEVPPGYGSKGFQASGVTFPTEGCWEVTGTVAATSLAFVTFVRKEDSRPALPSPSDLATPSPAGTFATGRALIGPCIAFELGGRASVGDAVNAWWWDQGASGDCSTRTSDVVRTKARTVVAAESIRVTIAIPLMGGTDREINVVVGPSGDGLAGTVSDGRESAAVRLVRVSEVDPESRPVP